MNTKALGNLTELQCMTRLYELGGRISIPFGNSEKYDFIMEYNGNIYKIQCKHSTPKFDQAGNLEYITFKTTWQSHNANGYKIHKYKESEIDFFATFYNGECYLVPITECSNQKILRCKSPKNSQTKKVSFLSDYSATKVLENM